MPCSAVADYVRAGLVHELVGCAERAAGTAQQSGAKVPRQRLFATALLNLACSRDWERFSARSTCAHLIIMPW